MTGIRMAVIDGRKACSRCAEWKPLEDFYARGNRPSGRESKCKACELARKQEWSAEHKGYAKAHYLANRQRYLDYGLRNYGITREQYDSMFRAQSGLCALCSQPERTLNKSGQIRKLAIDHDHACCPGKKSCGECIRGLLCHHCNTGLGAFDDSVDRLMQAAAYLITKTDILERTVHGRV